MQHWPKNKILKAYNQDAFPYFSANLSFSNSLDEYKSPKRTIRLITHKIKKKHFSEYTFERKKTCQQQYLVFSVCYRLSNNFHYCILLIK